MADRSAADPERGGCLMAKRFDLATFAIDSVDVEDCKADIKSSPKP